MYFLICLPLSVLVPRGSSKLIQVKVDNIPQFIVSTRFVCQFYIDGQVRQVNAQLLGETIYCEALEFNYTGNEPNISSLFSVIWDGSKPLDNPENIHGLHPLSQIHSMIAFLSHSSSHLPLRWNGTQLWLLSGITRKIFVRLVSGD